MWKKAVFVLLAVLMLTQLFGLCMVNAYAEEKEELKDNALYSKSCALTDGESDRILYGKEESLPLANASTTKIMTCILALENADPDDVVTVSAAAAGQPKVHLGMEENEQFYLRDLLYGLMLESYNDCAYAIAEHLDGSVEAFAMRMNEKAKELGCIDTHFVTPNGLDMEDENGSHHTTAADLCRIMSYCTWKSPKSEEFVALTRTREHAFTDLEGKSFAVANKNAFLDMMECAVTGKTGFTGKAGYCYVAAAEEGGRKFCIALLACGWPNNKNYKWADAKTLFGYGLDHYHLYKGTEKKTRIPEVEIAGAYHDDSLAEWGKRIKVSLYVKGQNENMTFLKADWEEATVVHSLDETICAPVKKGDKCGTVSYCIEGLERYRYDICAKKSVEQWNFTAFLRALWKEIT